MKTESAQVMLEKHTKTQTWKVSKEEVQSHWPFNAERLIKTSRNDPFKN
jgi:hypothetical protein